MPRVMNHIRKGTIVRFVLVGAFVGFAVWYGFAMLMGFEDYPPAWATHLRGLLATVAVCAGGIIGALVEIYNPPTRRMKYIEDFQEDDRQLDE